MKVALIIAGVVLGLLLFGGVIVFFSGVGVNNSLITQQESVKAAWSQVDIALQRRADLIPSLHRRPEPLETLKQLALIGLGVAVIAAAHIALEH